MNKQQYNYEYLQEFCKEHAIELIGEYEKINRDSIIRGKCKSDGCIEIFEKNFRCLTKIQNFGCKICSKEIRKIRVENTNLKNHGVKHTLQVKEFRDKGKQTNLEKYGVEFSLQSKEVRDKGKQTNLKKYGVEHSSQDPKTRTKFKETCILKFGVKNPSQNDEIKQQKIKTCLINHGVEHPIQNIKIKEQIKKTNIDKFGVENPSQNEDIKQLKKDTCFKNYGVEYPSQNPEILQKSFNSGCKFKDYRLPSGKIIKYQGYENFALDELLQDGILKDDFVNSCADVPEIWYEGLDKKTHRYYVDLFIPHQNKCIEVKSIYTITRDNETIKLKQQAVKDAGYLCEIWVYNEKGKKVECYI